MQRPLIMNSEPSVSWARSTHLWVGLMLVGLLAVYGSTMAALHHRWTQWDGAYAHGYFIVAFCVFSVAGRLPAQVVATRFRPLVILSGIGVGLLWSAGFATQVGLIEQVALYGAVLVIVLAYAGWAGLWSVSFPLLLMTLSIPAWEVLVPPLQTLTTQVATVFVRALGIPAFIDQNSFTLPFGTVVIAGGCAGLNYLTMGAALGSVNALYRGFTFRQSVLSIALLIGLAIIGNWGRVCALIFIAYQSQMQSELVYDHGLFGWWIFAGLFLIYLVAVSRIREPQHRPHRQRLRSKPVSILTLVGFSALLAISFWAFPVYLQSQAHAVSTEQVAPVVTSPVLRRMDSVRGAAIFRPDYHGVDLSEYFESNSELGLWNVARFTYLLQAPGKEMISDHHRLTEYPYRELPSEVLRAQGLQAVIVQARQTELRLWQFKVGNKATTQPWEGKLLQLNALMNGQAAVALWQARKVCDDASCASDLASVEANIESLSALLLEPMALY